MVRAPDSNGVAGKVQFKQEGSPAERAHSDQRAQELWIREGQHVSKWPENPEPARRSYCDSPAKSHQHLEIGTVEAPRPTSGRGEEAYIPAAAMPMPE